MYDSKLSVFDVVNATPFGRDPIKELAGACRRQGVQLFFYYSLLDWHHPDYYPRGLTGLGTERPDKGDWNRYVDFVEGQLTELLTNYGPIGGLWFDGVWDFPKDQVAQRWPLERLYSTIHRLQPDALIVQNDHGTFRPGEDYQTFEHRLPGKGGSPKGMPPLGTVPIEMSATMNESWGFNLADTKYKSPADLVALLAEAAAQNANLLLNIGPMASGEMPDEARSNLAGIGSWMARYGESVLSTTTGPVSPRPWGVTTRRGNRIYVHVLDWQDPVLFLPLAGKVSRAWAMVDRRGIVIKPAAGGVQLEGLRAEDDPIDRVYVLELTP
jgi:alpha-L-fucosidase